MAVFKTYRIVFVALIGAVVMAAMSLLPSSLGSQIVGAAPIAASPTLTLTPSPSSTVGSGTSVTFTADLEGGSSPTGNISAELYPVEGTCGGTPIDLTFPAAGTVSGNGPITSAPVTPAVGNYYGDAFYSSGDTNNNNNASSGNCSTLVLTVVNKATTTLTLSASPNPAASGTPVTFTADLEGGSSPTGTISLAAYLNNPSCNSATPTFSEDVSVTGSNGLYHFAPVTPAAGSYYGEAFYNGDGSNASASSGSCDLILVVNPAPVFHLVLWWLPLLKFLGFGFSRFFVI